MKRNFLSILTIIVLLAVFLRCSVDEDFFKPEQAESPNFPTNIEEYGKNFAKELRQTIYNLNEMGVDYSNAENTLEFKERFYKDWVKASPTLTRGNVSMDQIKLSPEQFAEGYRNLTPIQIKFIKRIFNEGKKASSYDEFFKVLMNINNDIYSQIPKIEQERLLYTTAVLYYGLSEIQSLEKQGQMLITPKNNIYLPVTQTKSAVAADWCTKFLATIWTIAVGEPTPAGEIVAAVATPIVEGVLLYEVIVCSQDTTTTDESDSTDDSSTTDEEESSSDDSADSPDETDREACLEKYYDCTAFTPYADCGTCLANCVVQGSWPSYMCP